MSNLKDDQINQLVRELEERAKELNCLYKIEDTLNDSRKSLSEAFRIVVNAIPPGWQYPAHTSVKLEFSGVLYKSDNFAPSEWHMGSEIVIQGKREGSITVYYTKEFPNADEGPFLKEERKLLNTICERIAHFILHKESSSLMTELDVIKDRTPAADKLKWKAILDMLKRTDVSLFNTIMRKLLHFLCWKEVKDAEELLKRVGVELKAVGNTPGPNENMPMKKSSYDNAEVVREIIDLTGKNMNDEEIISFLQKWIYEDKCSSLVNTVESLDTSLNEIIEALRKYSHLITDGELSSSIEKGLKVSLLRRFFSDQIEFISTAKQYVELIDFYDLVDRIILPANSFGKLGGKSAGMFVASKILQRSGITESISNIKIPKTWYIPSDVIIQFIHYNDLEDVIEQKYKEIEDIRREYAHIVQLFKNSEFPAEFVNGLSIALDDLGDSPLVVRSSSLLEDQYGAAFSGKYKSLFIANQGTKEEKINNLLDAIAEVYASTFGPDPIEYRSERGLLDFHEEMGIMIQQVVGSHAGKYFMPSFAGVAFSNNEFRWSPRIKRDDGLIRLVPGLGTRAVDRLSDDYPILLAPGQPNLRVNASFEEKLRYSPKKIDVINLESNEFESKFVEDVIHEVGDQFPDIDKVVAVVNGDHTSIPVNAFVDYTKEETIVTFDGLIEKTVFVKQLKQILDSLRSSLNTPVDIEFASDGKDFYLLQCRPQSQAKQNLPDPIPRDIPARLLLFSANKFVSNGKVPELTHIVYVDPKAYNEIQSRDALLTVGRVIGKLNKILPRRMFILIGPGRWGSRGDIKLGVNVSYADINNTAMLIEVARKLGNYTPDLSFGTHFFQDLVEASIRYLPLYPDEEGNAFNEVFLNKSKNILGILLPEYKELDDVVKVIDVPKSTNGKILKVLFNAELEEAIAMFAEPQQKRGKEDVATDYADLQPSDHWKWRYKMAETLAANIKKGQFGIKAMYVFGSTKNANSGPQSDIDLLIHVEENNKHQDELISWLRGWSLCISELNFLKTGYKTDGLLDVHFVTDADIKNKTSFASKINAITDSANPLKLGG